MSTTDKNNHAHSGLCGKVDLKALEKSKAEKKKILEENKTVNKK